MDNGYAIPSRPVASAGLLRAAAPGVKRSEASRPLRRTSRVEERSKPGTVRHEIEQCYEYHGYFEVIFAKAVIDMQRIINLVQQNNCQN